ncbi:MAG: DUF4268 domain-containing protein [Candidatus Marinimicrobia bacterium]|jgi:hypothetical protein|nr:DUF4268 domain-containing protein [Candidatus Scalindua sp.]MBT7901646.1 DUF4268 domain-containing protein [Candidatus Neomarinimicrobiota bacterium]
MFDKIQKVDPRSIWKHEAHDFTPWLADNIAELGETIGIELEVTEQEADVGGFSLDLLAKDLGRNANVIIENQLAVTDHDHLGKLLTYASGYDAGLIIWVSTEIREEHRQALDWLNQRTDPNTDFFGVVVEVIRIGDSRPALQFKVIVSPNEWQKSKKKQSNTASSEKSEKYREYFQDLLDELRNTHRFTSAKKGQPQNWYTFSSGNKKFVYGHSFAQGSRVRTEIYIDAGDLDENKKFFDKLYEEKEKIETDYGQELEWERLDVKRACRVAVYRPGSIEDSSDEIQKIKEWGIQNLLTMKNVFGKRK